MLKTTQATAVGRQEPPEFRRRLGGRGIALLLVLAGSTCLQPTKSVAADAPATAPAPATRPSVADAAERGDWPGVRALLAARADPTVAQADGTTALHWAVEHDDAEAVHRLLAAGASAKAGNRYGVTPLALACRNGDAGLVRALLAAGADAGAALPGGETALMTAARTGRVEPVRALLDAGAKVGAADRRGQTALMWAAADGHAAVVRLLADRRADPRARLKSGFTPMLFAARAGRLEVVRTLLALGVSPREAIQTDRKGDGNGGGTTPKDGVSALILAVENGHFELAAELLKAGADPNDQASGYGPLHVLTWVRKPNRGDDPDGQPPPAGSGNLSSLAFARLLVERGAKVNARLERGPTGKGKLGMPGATAFLMAAKTADLPYLQLLVELGADPLLGNQDGCTPLMAAAGIGTLAPDEEAGTEEEAVAAVEYLLARGADVNAVDRNGETAMHGAAYKSLPKMVRLLAERGAKADVWNRKDKYGWTPLDIAEGHRPGNFKPSAETAEAIRRVLCEAKAAGAGASATRPAAPSSRP